MPLRRRRRDSAIHVLWHRSCRSVTGTALRPLLFCSQTTKGASIVAILTQGLVRPRSLLPGIELQYAKQVAIP